MNPQNPIHTRISTHNSQPADPDNIKELMLKCFLSISPVNLLILVNHVSTLKILLYNYLLGSKGIRFLILIGCYCLLKLSFTGHFYIWLSLTLRCQRTIKTKISRYHEPSLVLTYLFDLITELLIIHPPIQVTPFQVGYQIQKIDFGSDFTLCGFSYLSILISFNLPISNNYQIVFNYRSKLDIFRTWSSPLSIYTWLLSLFHSEMLSTKWKFNQK